jgi:hypothetical protein
LLSKYAVELCALEVGVQFVKEIVIVDVAENPVTPSKVAAVVAGDELLLPEPEQVPEIVKDFVMPLAESALKPVCTGNDRVEATGLVVAVPPPPPPQAARKAVDMATTKSF